MTEFLQNNYDKIVVGLILALVAYWLGLRKDRHGRFAKECATFRGAFADEINLLEHGPTANPITETAHYILKSALDSHRRAYEKFKDRLWRSKRGDFERAWQDYLYPEGNHQDHHDPLVDYINDSDVNGELAIRKLALEKLHVLLSFAKDT